MKDRPRHLKLHLLDNQLLSSTRLRLLTDTNALVDFSFSQDYTFAIVNASSINPIVSQVFKQALGLRTLKESVGSSNDEVKVTVEVTDERVVETWVAQ